MRQRQLVLSTINVAAVERIDAAADIVLIVCFEPELRREIRGDLALALDRDYAELVFVVQLGLQRNRDQPHAAEQNQQVERYLMHAECKLAARSREAGNKKRLAL